MRTNSPVWVQVTHTVTWEKSHWPVWDFQASANYRMKPYLHDTKVKTSEAIFHYSRAGSAKYHVERQRTENMSSVFIVSRITRTVTRVLNYSSWSGSPFQNRNNRTRKGKKWHSNERPGKAHVWKIQQAEGLQLGKLRRNMKMVCESTHALEKENSY